MVGLSHVATRLVVREYLPEGARTIWPTEMLSSLKLPHENLTEVPETLRHESEEGLVPQILGNEEEPIRRSVAVLQNWGAEGIDINMGCPVRKALRHNYGVALMGDADYAAEVVAMTKRHARVPVSVKLRAGLQNDNEYLLRFVKGLVGAGVDWVTLHPRTASQQRRGSADWAQVKMIRDHVDRPVIGNGDVQTCDDVFAMLSQTGCDAVMIGRALLARPWLLWQVGERLGFPPPAGKHGFAPRTAIEEGAEYGRVLQLLLRYCAQFFREDLALKKFRFYVRMTSGWLSFGHALYALSTKEKSVATLAVALEQFFQNSLEMSPRTELRE